MSKNEKARSTAATVKRAEAAAFSGAAASFYRDFTTPTNARQVSDILPRGAANAVDGQTLAAAMGFKSVRELSKQVERERRAVNRSAPLSAASAGGTLWATRTNSGFICARLTVDFGKCAGRAMLARILCGG